MLRKILERIRTSGPFSPGKVGRDYVVNQTFNFVTNRLYGSPRGDLCSSSLGQSAIDTVLPRMGPFREIVQLNLDQVLSEKTISAWAQVTDAKDPQPSQIVTICQLVLDQALSCRSWEIRRLISHIAGTALLKIVSDKDLMRSLDSLAEAAGQAQEGRIFLGTALSRVPHILAFARSPISDLLSADHPQIPWQILREPKCLRFLLAEPKLTGIIWDRSSDRWLRRQLLTTTCNLAHKGELSNTLRKLLDRLLQDELRHSGPGYLWLLNMVELDTYHASVVSEQFPMYFRGLGTEDRQLAGISYSNNQAGDTGMPRDFRRRMDLACLHLDVAGDGGNRAGLQGRYGAILDMIRPALFNTSTDFRREVLKELLECESEGLRWGLAHLTPELFFIDHDLHNTAITRLLTDWHPWVLRETIDCLAKTPEILETERGNSYVKTILDVLEKLEREASPIINDIKGAFVKLLAKEPRFLDAVTIGANRKERP